MAKHLRFSGKFAVVGDFLRVAWDWLRGSRMRGAALASTASSTASDTAEISVPRPLTDFRVLGAIALTSLQLALVLLVIYQYQLESRTFFRVMLLGAVGFVVHALLPLRYRLSFFVLLSISAVGVAFGPLDGTCLIVLGLALIGICHLPVRMAVRLLLLLVATTLFRNLAHGAAPGTMVSRDLAHPSLNVHVPASHLFVHVEA